MTSENHEKPIVQGKRDLILGIVVVCFLAGGLFLWLQRASQKSSNTILSQPTLQINLPTFQYPTIPPSAPDFTVSMQSVASSGITGKVTFRDISGTVAILLRVDGLPGEEDESLTPAEIRHGSCASLGDLAYPMTAPDAGESETDLSINLKQFNTQKPMAVVLYRSPQDNTVVACGDIQ